jgi:hypothetical protein
MASEHIQNHLSQHLDNIHELFAIRGLWEITIGLLANMLYAENSPVEVSQLVQQGFHEAITAPMSRNEINIEHPLFDSAIQILEDLSEADIETAIPNTSATKAAMEHITYSLLTLPLEHDAFETLLRILLSWAAKRDLRASSRNLAKVYEVLVRRETDVGNLGDEKSLLVPFESILGELASERAEDTNVDLNDLIEPASAWVQYSHPSPTYNAYLNRMIATSYLILTNSCTEAFAIHAVKDLKLHEAAITTLRDSVKRKDLAVRTNAIAFLANLSQPAQNREVILNISIVSDLFYDAPEVEPELPIKVMRRLVSGGLAGVLAAQAAMSDVRGGVPSFKHVVEQLPDQKALQDAIGNQDGQVEGLGMQPPVKPGEYLTKDIAHIFVDIRRNNGDITAFITPKLVWALLNLVLLGTKTRNAFDTSEGVFGLGLALQGEGAIVDELAVEAIEALTRNNGLAVFKQIIESGVRDENEVAKKVAENATSVILRLTNIAQRRGLPADAIERLKEVVQSQVETGIDE